MNTLRANRVVALAALSHFTIELCNNYLPVVYPILITTLGLTYTHIGTIALVATMATTLLQPLFGYVGDRWHPYRFAALSVIWIGLVMGLVGFTWNYLSLLVLVALGGLASCAYHPSGASLAAAMRSPRRGTAISIFSVSGNLGTAFAPLLVTAGIGWLGLRGTSILIPISFLIGLFLYLQVRQIEPPPRQAVGSQPSAPRNSFPLGLALIVVVVMTRSWFQVSLATYLPVWLESQGYSTAAGGQVLFLFMIAMGIGGLVGGALSDLVGRWQVLALSVVLLGPIQWLFVTGSGALPIVLVGVMGFLIGTTFPVSIVMAQEAWPTGIGMASGLVMGLGWLPGGIGASVTGLIADRLSLAAGLQALILPPILGMVCLVAYTIVQRAQKAAPASA